VESIKLKSEANICKTLNVVITFKNNFHRIVCCTIINAWLNWVVEKEIGGRLVNAMLKNMHQEKYSLFKDNGETIENCEF
jgi:hypothetical protein